MPNLLCCLEDYRRFSKAKAHRVIPPNCYREGVTRIGKTWAAADDAARYAGKISQVIIDPPGSLSDRLLPQLIAGGHSRNTIFECIADLDKTLGFEFLPRPQSKNAVQRRHEMKTGIDMAIESMLWRRGLGPAWEHPWITEGGELAFTAHLTQKIDLPDHLIPYALMVETDQFTNYHMHTQSNDCRQALTALAKNRRLQEQMLPALRILKGIYFSEPFAARSKPSFDLEKALLLAKTIILSGRGDISEMQKRDIFGLVIRTVSRVVRRHYFRTGKPLPVRIVIDECLNSRLVGPAEIRDLLEGQKFGLSYDLLTQQTIDDPATMDGIYQGCNRLEFYRLNSDALAAIAANIIGVPLLDPHVVHHTDEKERQVIEGYTRESTETYTTHTHKDGSSESVAHGWTQRPIHATRKDQTDHYWQLSDQLLMVRQEVRTSGVGWRFVLQNGCVTKEYVKPRTLSFPEIAAKRSESFLRDMKDRPCFRKPHLYFPKNQKQTGKSSNGSTTRKRWE